MSEIYKRHLEIHNREVLKQLTRKNMNPTAIQVNDVDVNDFPSIMAINKATGLFPFSYTDLTGYMTNLHHRQISKVAKVDGSVVGYVIMQQDDKHTQHLLQIAISHEHRRNGIAKQLMIDIINNAIKTGINKIVLEVRTTNDPAINLYKTLGFNEEAFLRNFYDNANGYEFVLDLSKRTFDEQKHDRDTGGKFVPKGQTGAPSKGKTSKDDAKYTSSSNKEQKCGNCKFIIRQEGGNRCSKVDGSISSSGWSRFWKSSKKEDDPTKV